MPTPAERKALVFFSIVLVLGASGRAIRALHSDRISDAKARSALEFQIQAADSARKSGLRKSKRDKAKKLAPKPKGPIDLDVAPVEEIVALRHVGPALAKRIVADRDSFGPFGSLEGLRRVKGVGPSMVEKLDSAVTFSGVPRPTNTVISRPSAVPKARRKPHRRDPRP
ncbi:MAG TPA: helix-hairpin-helix domain-containing protein [Gemmatimonadaceae bacterium]|nr:helix-hairpin-helix domain-containing protein [Gemmatimonadaceae bacterium]